MRLVVVGVEPMGVWREVGKSWVFLIVNNSEKRDRNSKSYIVQRISTYGDLISNVFS